MAPDRETGHAAAGPLCAPRPDFDHPSLSKIADALLSAKANGRARVLIMGAHVLRAGAVRYLIDWMERGLIDLIALNGAGPIHDWEYARIGATTESVARYMAIKGGVAAEQCALVRRDGLHPDLDGTLHDVEQRVLARLVAGRARKATLLRPATVAVHDDRDVARDLVDRNGWRGGAGRMRVGAAYRPPGGPAHAHPSLT